VVFAGKVLIWLMNALASTIRFSGNMLVPSLAICLGVLLLVPLSPLLIYGSLAWVFATLGVALVIYGTMMVTAIASGVWFKDADALRATPQSVISPRAGGVPPVIHTWGAFPAAGPESGAWSQATAPRRFNRTIRKGARRWRCPISLCASC